MLDRDLKETKLTDATSSSRHRRSEAFFNDGHRVIDMAICYKPNLGRRQKRALHQKMRQRYEREMQERGLELEHEPEENSIDGETAYIKVHASWEALTRRAEMDHLQKPVCLSNMKLKKPGLSNRLLTWLLKIDPFELQGEFAMDNTEYFTDAYDRKRPEDFLIEDSDSFFSQAQRILITLAIMESITIKVPSQFLGNKTFLRQQQVSNNKESIESMKICSKETPENYVFHVYNSYLTVLKPTSETINNKDKGNMIANKLQVNNSLVTYENKAAEFEEQNQPLSQCIDCPDVVRPNEVLDTKKCMTNESNETCHKLDKNTLQDANDKLKGNKVVGETDGHRGAAKSQPRFKNVTLSYMLQEGVYQQMFPVHDGDLDEDNDQENNKPSTARTNFSMRKYLFDSWARPRQWRRYQPLDVIRDYYGEHVGLYFAWLGFYTKMLIVPSILGLLIFLSGIVNMFSDDTAHQLCNNGEVANWVICRACPTTRCTYATLGTSCLMFRMTRIINNSGATVFATFMSIWAIVFLQLWKRYQAELTARWNVGPSEFNAEHTRAKYRRHATVYKENSITKTPEPQLKRSLRYTRLMGSFITTTFLVAARAMAGVMVYKLFGSLFWSKVSLVKDRKHTFAGVLMASVTASVMNGILITIMSCIYTKIATFLTHCEISRTDSQFEHSFVAKAFIFEFVNYYGALFYMAFVRGQFVEAPNKQKPSEWRCPSSGCLLDVTIQLAIIFTGKQAFNNVLELGVPALKNLYMRLKQKIKKSDSDVLINRWEADSTLTPCDELPLFNDYLEMIIQFGFVTMFVPAFPLAPLFALINNIIEIRLDAFKNLTQKQRFLPRRAKDIEPWFQILSLMTMIAVVTNAMIIAFTSDFIDHAVYHNFHRQYHSNISYIEFLFSPFATEDWCDQRPENISLTWNNRLGESCTELISNTTTCYIRDYRIRQGRGNYEYSATWMQVLMAKLAYVLVLEHLIVVVQALIKYLIPEVPDHVTAMLSCQKFLQQKAFMKREFKAYQTSSSDEDIHDYKDIVNYPEWDAKCCATTLPPETSINQLKLFPPFFPHEDQKPEMEEDLRLGYGFGACL